MIRIFLSTFDKFMFTSRANNLNFTPSFWHSQHSLAAWAFIISMCRVLHFGFNKADTALKRVQQLQKLLVFFPSGLQIAREHTPNTQSQRNIAKISQIPNRRKAHHNRDQN